MYIMLLLIITTQHAVLLQYFVFKAVCVSTVEVDA